MNENKNASQSAVSLALLRLALLVVPELLAVNYLAHNGIICAVVCLAVFATWLSVDVGPFRAAPRQMKPALAKSSVKASRMARLHTVGCEILVFVAVFQTRMMAHWH